MIVPDGANALPMSPRPTPLNDDELARRQQLAARIVADGLLTILIRERLRELDATDAVTAAAAEQRARGQGRRAGRRGSEIGEGRAGTFTSR